MLSLFHRQRRAKLITKSLFDDVKGVGPVNPKKTLRQVSEFGIDSSGFIIRNQGENRRGTAFSNKIMKAARRETANEL